MKTATLCLVATSLACASGRSLVQKATAYDTYFQDSYMMKCVEKVGPPTCRPCQTAINDAARIVPLANKVQKLGPLPKQEVEELKDLIARLEACP